MNIIERLTSLYQRFDYAQYYNILLANQREDTNEYIQSSRFLYGMKGQEINGTEEIYCTEGDLRIDLPVWFGNPEQSSCRVIVFGLEPRDTDSIFNIEKIGNRVFGTPFGIDRWNRDSSVKGKPQNKYYRVFQNLIENQLNFVLFSDIVKEYEIVSVVNKEGSNDRNARESFFAKAATELLYLREEIHLVQPTHILTLGNDSFKVLSDHYPEITHRIRHPANGGEGKARQQLAELFGY